MTEFRPMDALVYPRFEGISTFMRLPHTRDLDNVDVAIVGIPFDTGGTYRVGARFGPQAVRNGSRLLRPYNPSLRVGIFDHLNIVDFGDVPISPGFIEQSYGQIVDALLPFHELGIVPIGIGGDHSIVLPELRAAAATHGTLGLAHFDSHSDTWDQYFGQKYTHGTPFLRAIEEGLIDPARSIQVGMRGPVYDEADMREADRLGLEMIAHDELFSIGLNEAARRVRERVGDGPTFLSFDIDFIDPAFAPATGTPEIGGPTTREALYLLQQLKGVNIVAADMVEVIPQYDVSEITAMAGANVVYQMLGLLALRKAAG